MTHAGRRVELVIHTQRDVTANELRRDLQDEARAALGELGQADALDRGEISISVEHTLPEAGQLAEMAVHVFLDLGYALGAALAVDAGKAIIRQWRNKYDIDIEQGTDHLGESSGVNQADAESDEAGPRVS